MPLVPWTGLESPEKIIGREIEENRGRGQSKGNSERQVNGQSKWEGNRLIRKNGPKKNGKEQIEEGTSGKGTLRGARGKWEVKRLKRRTDEEKIGD